MCMTLQPSRMSGTILYGAETLHNDQLLHVMGYQNRAENLGSGPNAMLLPIPSALPMGPENAIDLRACKNVLRDYEKTWVTMNTSRSRSMSKSFGDHDALSTKVQVFDSGSYTVVLASDPKYIDSALSQVPADRRPNPNPAIFEAYGKLYPGWHIAMCCYNAKVDAEPMLWQYQPLDPSHIWLPALDGHDGRAPNLTAHVQRDHTVIVSLVNSPRSKFSTRLATKQDIHTLSGDPIPDNLQYLFGKHFFGTQTHGTTKNGDFMIPVAKLAGQGEVNPHDFQVSLPPGA